MVAIVVAVVVAIVAVIAERVVWFRVEMVVEVVMRQRAFAISLHGKQKRVEDGSDEEPHERER